jgi:hypothetical protein
MQSRKRKKETQQLGDEERRERYGYRGKSGKRWRREEKQHEMSE